MHRLKLMVFSKYVQTCKTILGPHTVLAENLIFNDLKTKHAKVEDRLWYDLQKSAVHTYGPQILVLQRKYLLICLIYILYV